MDMAMQAVLSETVISGFTGTQKGMTAAQRSKLRILMVITGRSLRHGDCIGADAEAHDIARSFGWHITIHPPINPKKRAFKQGDVILEPKPYLDRNRDIVDFSSVLYACPSSFEPVVRSGTWYTIRYARRQRQRVCIIFPDGTVWRENFLTDSRNNVLGSKPPL